MGIEEIRNRFKTGTVIRIIKMVDDLPCAYHVPEGVLGTVRGVDENGLVLMQWQNGSSVGLMANDDIYEIVGVPA